LCRANALILLPVGVWTIRSTLKAEGKAGAVRAATAFVLVTLLTISPATLHNRIVAGRWALVSTNFGENWKIGNSYDSTGGFWNPQQALVPVFSSGFLRLQLKKAGLLLSDYEQPNNLNYYQMAEGRPWLELPLLSWGFYLAFGLAGALLTRSQRWKLFPLYAFFLLYGASVVVFFITGRFRLPLWPVLILFTAAGFTRAVSLVRGRRLAEPAAVMAPALALCLYLVLSNPRTIQAQYFDNLALVHLERGDTTAAVGELERELVYYPSQPQTLRALAYYLQKEGRDAEASRYLELLMAKIGERPELLREAGLLDIRLGKTGRGVQRLARYLELLPQAPDSQRIAEYIGSLSGHDGGP
ncbi:MAG: tetratricopeptide repeat protein, partial [Candidatus Glassbacteria bacterium]